MALHFMKLALEFDQNQLEMCKIQGTFLLYTLSKVWLLNCTIFHKTYNCFAAPNGDLLYEVYTDFFKDAGTI
jgi:hypothetical protein